MPNIKSAKKRVSVTEAKSLVNKNNKTEVKSAIKKLNAALDAADVEAALKPVLENKDIFGVNLYEVGLAETVIKYFTELIAGPGAIRATLKKYV